MGVLKRYMRQLDSVIKKSNCLIFFVNSMFCRNCGNEQNSEAQFCHHCGNKHLQSQKISVQTSAHETAKDKPQNRKNVFLFLGLFIPICLVFLIWLAVSENNDSFNGKETLAEKTPPPFSPTDGEKLINKFFNLLDRRDYEQAFNLFSLKKQDGGTADQWKKGYKNTVSHAVNSVSCYDFICELDVTATENNTENMRRVNYKFRYYLTYNAEYSLKIDKALFISQNIEEIIKSYGSEANSDGALLGSFVKITCTEPNFERSMQGSGTIIGNDTVLTNFHVGIGYPEYCFAQRVDNQGLTTDDIYVLDYSIVENKGFDFWTFHIIKDDENTNENPIPIPLRTCTKNQIQIGDKIRIYGFPAASGGNLTITDGLVSGLDTRVDGLYITSAKIDHGNSGGAAVDVSKNCFLGVPTLGLQGDFESYGGILSLHKILEIEPRLFSKTDPISITQ